MDLNQKKILLPRLISDGMILQRNTRVKIWGWAPEGDVIKVSFIDEVYRTTVEADGTWKITMPTKDAGGPFMMVIETGDGTQSISINDILLGDVWLCSGQSNMEMRMETVKEKYSQDIERADNEYIRQFLVPVKYDFEKPQTDFETGNWESANPQSVLNFTAAGYFFALRLYEKYRIPIGLINSSLGGSPAEAWMSEEALAPFPQYLNAARKMRNKDYVDAILMENQITSDEWHKTIDKKDLGLPEDGKHFYLPDYDACVWPCINIPSYWEEEGLGKFNGAVWFRKEIDIPATLLGNPGKLLLGNIVEEDTIYINGVKVGSLPSQYIPRKYEIAEGLLKEGKNTIAIRVVCPAGKGGFYKGKPYQLKLGDYSLDLAGEWKYMIGAKSNPMPVPLFVMWQPTGLYNGMIAPIRQYAIKGVIWYQGETNTQKPNDYESLFKALITDWRDKWGQGDLPFLYVQLPNYQETYTPSAGNWAELREAQRKTLEVPSTGMAVTIDIGEWNDVHPVNKKDVGKRLALAAQKVAYGDYTVVASGPMISGTMKAGNRIYVSFSDTGSGLVTRGGGCPGHFAIAGADKKFVWADTCILDNHVVAWHDKVPEPVFVRYAWADNPEGANLYNRECLPASPFTTE